MKASKAIASVLSTIAIVGGTVVLNSTETLTIEEYKALIEVYDKAIQAKGRVTLTGVNTERLIPKLNEFVQQNDPDATALDDGKLTKQQRLAIRRNLFDRAEGKTLLERSLR